MMTVRHQAGAMTAIITAQPCDSRAQAPGLGIVLSGNANGETQMTSEGPNDNYAEVVAERDRLRNDELPKLRAAIVSTWDYLVTAFRQSQDMPPNSTVKLNAPKIEAIEDSQDQTEGSVKEISREFSRGERRSVGQLAKDRPKSRL